MEQPQATFVMRSRTRGDDARTIEERIEDLKLQIDRLMDVEHQKEVGARIKEARENSPFKQRQLAARAHVQLRTWQAWEAGRGINRANVEVAAKALRVDAERLWRGAPEEPSAQSARLESLLDHNADVIERVDLKLDALVDAMEILGSTLPADQSKRLLVALLQARAAGRSGTSAGSTGEAADAQGG